MLPNARRSFTAAFTSVAAAVAFCMDVQYRLLDTPWPAACLKLPGCRPVSNTAGDVMFVGPRVRMGVHWAREGTVAHRLHALTKHRVFAGPGLTSAQEVGDAAWGGQVLVSHDAWVEMRGSMGAAGFPVVRCLGLFQSQSFPTATWLYHVPEVVGKPLGRTFPPPRGVQQLWPPVVASTHSLHQLAGVSLGGGPLAAGTSQGGFNPFPLTPTWGLHITAAPVARGRHTAGLLGGDGEEEEEGSPVHLPQRLLTFVAARLEVPQRFRQQPRKAALPPGLAYKLEEVMAVQAQQFRGYMFEAPTSAQAQALQQGAGVSVGGAQLGFAEAGGTYLEGAAARETQEEGAGGQQAVYVLAFQSATDALRFCHATQVGGQSTACMCELAAAEWNGWLPHGHCRRCEAGGALEACAGIFRLSPPPDTMSIFLQSELDHARLSRVLFWNRCDLPWRADGAHVLPVAP